MCGTMHILRWRPQRNGTQRAVNAVWPVGVRGHLDLIYLTDGNYWPLLGGHNLTIWLLRAIRSFIPFCEASYRLRAKYDASKSRERVGFRARLLSGRRVALASVLQYGLHRFAGRCRFGEYDAAGMERRGYPACAALSHISGRDPAVEWNAV